MKKLLLLGAAFLALQALPAMAEEGSAPKGGKHDGMFQAQDANKDGVVSEEEFLAFGKSKFAEMDTDHDGKLTQEEAKSHRAAMRDKWKEKHGDMKKEKEAGGSPSADPAPAPSPEPAPVTE